MASSGIRSSARLWLLIAAACLVAAVLDGLQTFLQGIFSGEGPDASRIVFQAGEWVLLGALTLITYQLGRRFPLRRPHLGRSMVVHLTGAALLCAGWATSGVLLRRSMGDRWIESFGADLASWTLTSVPWSFFMYFAVLGCVHAFMYYEESRDREVQASRLSSQLSEARLSALRMQLQPHFLFNSLNAITVLVRDQRTELATRMLELLSDVLRSVLRSDRPNEIPLSEELQLMRQYLAIEQVRFSDRLGVTLTIAAATMDALVPTFILQPLVENAIRHGVSQRDDAVQIEIGTAVDGEFLVVWVNNDSPTDDLTRAGFGVGLQNTRQRLETLYGERAALTLDSVSGQTTVRVRIPLRRAAQIESERPGRE